MRPAIRGDNEDVSVPFFEAVRDVDIRDVVPHFRVLVANGVAGYYRLRKEGPPATVGHELALPAGNIFPVEHRNNLPILAVPVRAFDNANPVDVR